MVVASVVDGRVRIRDEKLKNASTVERVKDELMANSEVSSVEGNHRVGSLLVLYDAARGAVEKILKAVSELLGSEIDLGESAAPAEAKPRCSFQLRSLAEKLRFPASVRTKKKMLNWALLGTFLVSITAALFYLKRVHVLAGLLFTALVADHVYSRRAQMFV